MNYLYVAIPIERAGYYNIAVPTTYLTPSTSPIENFNYLIQIPRQAHTVPVTREWTSAEVNKANLVEYIRKQSVDSTDTSLTQTGKHPTDIPSTSTRKLSDDVTLIDAKLKANAKRSATEDKKWTSKRIKTGHIPINKTT